MRRNPAGTHRHATMGFAWERVRWKRTSSRRRRMMAKANRQRAESAQNEAKGPAWIDIMSTVLRAHRSADMFRRASRMREKQREYYAKHDEENRRHRRQFADASRFPRGAAYHERSRRHAHQRGVRLHVDVSETLRNHAARCGDLRIRCGSSCVSHGGARTVQGYASADG